MGIRQSTCLLTLLKVISCLHSPYCIFSCTMMQLEQVLCNVSLTPVSTCLLVMQAMEKDLMVTVYHQNTFGSTVGLLLNLNLLTVKNRLLVTSSISQTMVYVIFLGIVCSIFVSLFAWVFLTMDREAMPATLHLEQVLYNISSTLNGTCLLVVQATEKNLMVTVYHQNIFDSMMGLLLDLSSLIIENRLLMTSSIG